MENQVKTELTPAVVEALFSKLESIEKNTLLASKNVLNLKEVEIITGYTEQTIRALMRKRQIPFYRPTGRIVFFDRQEVENWQRTGKVEARTDTDAEEILQRYINS